MNCPFCKQIMRESEVRFSPNCEYFSEDLQSYVKTFFCPKCVVVRTEIVVRNGK